MRKDVQYYVKNCKSCQVNKHKKLKYGKLPSKLVIETMGYLCVDLVGPYTLRGKDKSEIDSMCLTMIDPASSWLEIEDLPVAKLSPTDTVKNKVRKSKD